MSKSVLILGRNKEENIKLANKIKFNFLDYFFNRNIIVYFRSDTADKTQKYKEKMKFEKLTNLFKINKNEEKIFIIYDFNKFFIEEKNYIKEILESAKKYKVNLILECKELDVDYLNNFDKKYLGYTDKESDCFFYRRKKLEKNKYIEIL